MRQEKHIPRIRGVEPDTMVQLFVIDEYSPHTRG